MYDFIGTRVILQLYYTFYVICTRSVAPTVFLPSSNTRTYFLNTTKSNLQSKTGLTYKNTTKNKRLSKDSWSFCKWLPKINTLLCLVRCKSATKVEEVSLWRWEMGRLLEKVGAKPWVFHVGAKKKNGFRLDLAVCSGLSESNLMELRIRVHKPRYSLQLQPGKNLIRKALLLTHSTSNKCSVSSPSAPAKSTDLSLLTNRLQLMGSFAINGQTQHRREDSDQSPLDTRKGVSSAAGTTLTELLRGRSSGPKRT